MSDLVTGSASIDIDAAPDAVFDLVTDLDRMGEWSPESGAVRWIDGSGAALGARFAGDNEVTLGPIPLKRWTTESEVTAFDRPSVFEFVSAGYTTWRFEFAATADGGTRLTESFAYPPYTGFAAVSRGLLGARAGFIHKGVESTLAAIKQAAETS